MDRQLAPAGQCAACVHPQRSAIEAALAAGTTILRVAYEHELSEAVIGVHKRRCMARLLSLQEPVRIAAERVNLYAAAVHAMQESQRLGAVAEESGDIRAALLGVREYTRGAELAHKAQGGDERADFTRDPRWIRMRDRILTALRPHPEACKAVVAALSEPE